MSHRTVYKYHERKQYRKGTIPTTTNKVSKTRYNPLLSKREERKNNHACVHTTETLLSSQKPLTSPPCLDLRQFGFQPCPFIQQRERMLTG